MDDNNKDIEQKKQQAQLQRATGAIIQFSSPFPPPEVLAKYESLQPGLINKIIEMTQIEGNHRRECENKQLSADIEHIRKTDTEARVGQVFAFIIVMSALVGGLSLASFSSEIGAQIAGGLIGSTAIAAIAIAFIKGRNT